MLEYLILIMVCTFLSYIISRLGNKIVRYILLGVIILLLSVIGGCRDTTVGTDVEVYGVSWFESACNYNNIIEYVTDMGKEDVGYIVLNFIVSRFTNNINVFLFILQIICNTLVIITLYKYRRSAPLWLSFLCYMCIYHFRNYNYLRQSIALSILFFSVRYLEQNKLIKFVISILIASQFHFTTIICIILYPLKYIIDKDKKIYNYVLILGIIVLLLITLNLLNVLTFLYDVGIINERIYSYILKFSDTAANFNIIETGFRILFIFMYVLKNKKLKSKLIFNKFLFICSVIDVILFQFRNIIQYSDRIAFYFGYMTLLLIPQLPDALNSSYKNRVALKAIFIALLLVFWYYKFIYARSCQIYPYTSSILGIN